MNDPQQYKPTMVTAIVPAYNEERYIAAVLAALRPVRHISQIIIIDDASTDATAQVVSFCQEQDPRILLCRLPQNQGKGGALAAGIRLAQSDLLLFLDADLIGLRPEHVRALIRPVRTRRSLMALGLFQHGRRHTDNAHRLFPFLSGQRCLFWPAFRHTPALDGSRYGVETALSLYAWQNHYGVQRVAWPGVTHATGTEKENHLRWFWSEASMWLDIGSYVTRHFVRPRLHHFFDDLFRPPPKEVSKTSVFYE